MELFIKDHCGVWISRHRQVTHRDAHCVIVYKLKYTVKKTNRMDLLTFMGLVFKKWLSTKSACIRIFPIGFQSLKSHVLIQIMYRWSLGGGYSPFPPAQNCHLKLNSTYCAGGNSFPPPQDFGRDVNPIPIKVGWGDYPHHIATCPPNFQTFLHALQSIKCWN